MGLILNIETATNVCSVALAKDGQLIALKESKEDKTHAALLTVFIEEILKENNIKISNLDAIAVSKGPGSYTGLRIGVSAVKGLCYGANKSLISVCTLQSMAQGIIEQTAPEKLNSAWLCPMLDARRMEVYSAFYDHNNEKKKDIAADIIDENSYQDILDARKVFFFGNGADKCREFIKHENAEFIADIFPSAINVMKLSERAFSNQTFEDVAYFEPFYLKDFVALTSKKNLLK